MLTKEQQELLDMVAKRDGSYESAPTPAGTRYTTADGKELFVDTTEAQPSEIEQLKARVAELEAALTRSR